MNEVKDKVVLVTGGSTGLGAGVVEAFLEDGAKHVAILDVDTKNGVALEEELKAKHGTDRVKFYKCDVTTDELNEAYEDLLKNFGYIDVVVNNAGLMNDGPGVYEKMIAINVTALIKSSMKAYNLMRKDHGGKGGTIINIASIVALYQSRMLPIYCATKSAVLQFSNCLGMEPHYPRSDVRVLTICFGCTKTALFSPAKVDAIDKETFDIFTMLTKKVYFQEIDSAVKGLMEVYHRGTSASTWLITDDRPAEDVTDNVKKAYEIMSQGVL